MKEFNKEILKESANKLMFDLTEEELDTLFLEFSTIKKQMELIGKIKGVDNAVPMTFPFDVSNDFLRDDIPSNPVDRDVVLRNACDVVDGQIRLPKVVG